MKKNQDSRWSLFGLSLSMLMSSLDTSIANAGLPTLAEAFHAPFSQVQWIVLSYLLAITTLIVSAGKLGDLFGRRRLLISGIYLFTLASLLCGIAPNLGLLIIARAAQGLGAALMMALTVAFVGEIVVKEKLGSAMGLLGTMSAVGTALGPSLGGILILGFGWRSLFLVNIPLGILNLILAHRYLPLDISRSEKVQASFDKVGTVILTFTLLVYALSMTVGHPSLILVAILGAGLFVFTETKVKSPLIQLEMFRDLTLSGSLAMSMIVSTVLMATLVVGPFYLSRALRLSTAHVGLILSIGPIVVALTGVLAGKLTDRYGGAKITIIGLCGIAVGSILFSLMRIEFGVVGYIISIVVVTFGYSLFQTANNTVIMKEVSSDRRGVVSGMLNLARNLGLISGASVMGAIFANSASELSGLQNTFAVAILLILLALSITRV
jgi:EmrB/QacA subfamily drug resistance transporter